MKKKLFFLFFFAFLLNLEGNETESPTKLKSDSRKYYHHIYLGPETFLFDLHTHVKNIKVDGLKFFGGLSLRYEYLKPWTFYAGIDFFSALSNQSFEAKYKEYNFHHNNGITGFGNFEIRLGYPFSHKNGILTPFFGIGAYSFGNNGHNFHFRENLFYYAAGLRSLFELNPLFSLGLNVKVLYSDDTYQKFTYLTKNHKIKLSNHVHMWGCDVGIPLVWHLGTTKRWDILLEPYFLKFDFSEVQNIYGLRLLFGVNL